MDELGRIHQQAMRDVNDFEKSGVSMAAYIIQMQDRYGFHGEHPVYVRESWKYEVANDDTQLGYWEWVYHKIEPVLLGW